MSYEIRDEGSVTGQEQHFDVRKMGKLLEPERADWARPAELLAKIGVAPGMTVADVGCGPGFFALPMAATVGEAGRVHAVDDSPEMLAALAEGAGERELTDRVEMHEADAAATGLPGSSVDLTFCAFVYHEVEDRDALLVEFTRITRPGGKVVMVDWRKGVKTPPGPPDQIRLTRDEMTAPMEVAGLTVAALDFSDRYDVLIGRKASAE